MIIFFVDNSRLSFGGDKSLIFRILRIIQVVIGKGFKEGKEGRRESNKMELIKDDNDKRGTKAN